jgi:hypothetical protein
MGARGKKLLDRKSTIQDLKNPMDGDTIRALPKKGESI